MKRRIWVTWSREGIHKYPSAPKEVDFLRHPHRHIFHFRVEIDVHHDDREIEFIMFKRELESLHNNEVLQLDYKSCEMMATDLKEYLDKHYPGRTGSISVSEDNENGAIISW